MGQAKIDANRKKTIIGVSSVDLTTPTTAYVNPATGAVLINLDTGGTGTVTSVSVVTANGVSGTVATPATTPAITLTLGAITPTTVNGLTFVAQLVGFTIAGGTTSKTLTVPLDATVSGTNTGDQTSVTGNAGTATALQTARTIGGVSFNGTANITVASATGGFLITGGDLGLTGTRVSKGWFTDLEVTNAIVASITGNAATATTATTVTTNANLTGDVTSVGNATTIGAAKVTEAMQILADNTTQNVSTAKHGYAPKITDTTKFLKGDGTWASPTTDIATSQLSPSTSQTIATGLSAYVYGFYAITGSLFLAIQGNSKFEVG